MGSDRLGKSVLCIREVLSSQVVEPSLNPGLGGLGFRGSGGLGFGGFRVYIGGLGLRVEGYDGSDKS